jgi:hypothetical protein
LSKGALKRLRQRETTMQTILAGLVALLIARMIPQVVVAARRHF